MIKKCLSIGLLLLSSGVWNSCGVREVIRDVLGYETGPLDLIIEPFSPDNPNLLGYTTRTGGDEYTCSINDSLEGDYRLDGVMIHELLQPVVLLSPGIPSWADETWFSVTGDTQPIGAQITEEEAGWILHILHTYPKIKGLDILIPEEPWLAESVHRAILRINDGLSKNVYKE